jgi:sodium:sulfate symporter-like transmembrane protein
MTLSHQDLVAAAAMSEAGNGHSHFWRRKIGPDGADRHPVHDMVREQAERAARHGWESKPGQVPGSGGTADRTARRRVRRLSAGPAPDGTDRRPPGGPGVVALFTGDDSTVYADISSVLDEGVVAVLAAGLLFVLPLSWRERRFTLNWNEAARIDWGTILLFGSGIALGNLMSKTGLAKRIGEGLSDTLNVSNEIAITILVVVIAVIISETTSNTASAAIVVPIGIFLAQAVNMNPVVPGLAAVFGANYGFMLPVSTPPNAIVYSSGYLPITRMIKAGAVFDVIGAVLCIGGVAVMARLVGLTG